MDESSLREIGDIWSLSPKEFACEETGDALRLTLPFPLFGHEEEWSKRILAVADKHALPPRRIEFAVSICARRVKPGIQTLPEVKNVIAVASGKGGVGKSTVTANLALALARAGARVGVLDADLYGPSQHIMLGARNLKPREKNKKFLPVEVNGIRLMSMGFLVAEGQALVWRGPLITRGLQQLFRDTAWQNLDYLLVDMPPGTGDIQLTVTQAMPLTAAAVVSTPQDIALVDAEKAIDMFQKTGIPVLGVLENMSYYLCPGCGRRDAIFGTGGGARLAGKYRLPLLGQLPLTGSVRRATDEGRLESQPEEVLRAYADAAESLTRSLAHLGKDYSRLFPKTVLG